MKSEEEVREEIRKDVEKMKRSDSVVERICLESGIMKLKWVVKDGERNQDKNIVKR